MTRNYWNEKWKPIVFDDKISEDAKFKISNYGRVIDCRGDKEKLMKKYFTNGYQTIPLKQKVNGKATSRCVHRLVAEHFLEQGDGICVIHLDYDKTNNRLENLQWATKREKELHQFSNPEFQKIMKRNIPKTAKLTETRVKLIKRKLNDPNRKTRLKILAKQFGVSEMQLHRIKTGENWGYVTEY